jgi:superfamily II DNA/RNA helicase
VPSALVRALAADNIIEPFPIQTATLPSALAGKDVLGRGRTGSGKTVAFAVPMAARLSSSEGGGRRSQPRALVLVPTRELAAQVAATCSSLGGVVGLKVATVYGGVSQHPQVTALRRGVDILVACPGRLEDLIGQGHCRLDRIEITVLDEADHMADLGFLPAVRRILDQTPPSSQRLLFSATLDKEVDVVVKRYLRDPVVCSVDPVTSAVPDAVHHVFTVQAADKAAVVRDLAGGEGRSLLFTRTKHGASRLARQLNVSGIGAVELHGNLSQNARDRNLAAFTRGSKRVLVATDIAARGIHVDDIALVVHVDPPAEHKAYLHRSGRTARAGAAGIVVTLATPNQAADVRKLTREAGIRPLAATIAPGDDKISQLRGPLAPISRATAAPASTAAVSAARGGDRRGNSAGRGRRTRRPDDRAGSATSAVRKPSADRRSSSPASARTSSAAARTSSSPKSAGAASARTPSAGTASAPKSAGGKAAINGRHASARRHQPGGSGWQPRRSRPNGPSRNQAARSGR